MPCLFRPLEEVDVDLLVLPWFEGEAVGAFAALDQASAGELTRALASGEFPAKPFDLFVTPVVDQAWKPGRVALIGAGRDGAFTPGLARRLGTTVGLLARQRRVARLGFLDHRFRFALPSLGGLEAIFEIADAAEVLIEALAIVGADIVFQVAYLVINGV